MLVLYDSIIR